MKKVFVSSAVALALSCGVLVAEESGIFIGVGAGYSQSEVKISGALGEAKDKVSGLSYEVLLGYKQFFTPKFGLRYYANFASANQEESRSEKLKANVMNYGLNIDALYNFVARDSANLGVFVGVGVGYNTWSGSAIDAYKSVAQAINEKMDKSSIDCALNVGLRTAFAKHHGIEVVAKVPFMQTTLFDARGVKVTAEQHYNVGARYILSF